MRWEVYKKEKDFFIQRDILSEVTYMRGGKIVWTCAEDNIIEEKE